MKVLHLLSSNKFSGAENVACQIINMFKDEIDMEYCSPYGQISESLDNQNINYNPINKLSISEIKKIISQYKPDVIHAHDVRASVMAVLATNKIPIISHIHGNFGNTNKNFIKSLLYRLFLERFSKIIVVSDSVLNEYKYSDKLKPNCKVLYNIIDRENVLNKVYEDNNDYDMDCIFLGRLTYPKNPERLIEIMKPIIERHPNIKLGIIGDGDLKDIIQYKIKKENMNKNVKFMGFMNNPYKALSQSKVMIMCSRYEGTPMAALEAMTLGVPIVSTPVDGLKNIIENGKEGFLNNDNLELSKYICNIIENNDLHEKMSKNSKNKMKIVCGIENYKGTIRDIYNNL